MMPRNARRTQKPEAPQEQGYGVRGEQIAAQRAMPLPDNRTPGPPSPGGNVVPMPGTQPPQGPQDPAALLEVLKGMPPPPAGGLARPSDRPEEAITAPQTTPPASRNVAAETFELMAEATGDPRFTVMAQRARSI
jgi:hypothetical protein